MIFSELAQACGSTSWDLPSGRDDFAKVGEFADRGETMAGLHVADVVRFGDFVFDRLEARLVGPAGPVHLGRKAFSVLEALVTQPGHLLTKEHLFETVWDGTLVSESALPAVVKELRRALGDEARSPHYIENVYGRGYRFIAPVEVFGRPERNAIASARDKPAPADDVHEFPSATATVARTSPLRMSRRKALGWIAAGGGACGGAVVMWRRASPPAISPDVERLILQARHLMDQNSYEGQYEAIGLLRRVVQIAPDYADGWGLLGMSYAIPSHYRERDEGLQLRARARAAGARALEINPGCAYGELALGLELPIIGFWADRDQRFERALANDPTNDDVLTFIAVVLQFNGRAEAAIHYYDRIRQRPLTPSAYSNYIRALWSAGRFEQADRALDDAVALYPTQTTLWFDRLQILSFGGRADAALALLHNPTGRPPSLDGNDIADLEEQVNAVRDPSTRQARDVLAKAIQDARLSAGGAQAAIRLAGALGAPDEAFAVADAYYFSRGYTVPDYRRPGSAASLDQRKTRLLFEPETATLRVDRRFELLVSSIGLTQYWSTSQVVPAYRKRS